VRPAIVTGMNSQSAAADPVIELARVDKLARVEKVCRSGKIGFPALSGVDLTVMAGEMVAITGPSGSAKSTIINLIDGIDRPTVGNVTVAGRDRDEMSEEQLAAWRGRTIGIVFQFFQLMPTLTAAENAAEARRQARVRMVIQAGWASLGAGLQTEDDMVVIGETPRDWLFPKMSVLVRHAGAGVTAAGLRPGSRQGPCR
jgi:ABC-type glutathione transport system ATPase component